MKIEPRSLVPNAFVRTLCAFVVACACTCAAGTPSVAYAWFNDVTDSYPASQEVPVTGDVLTAADVPEGAYSISATTSSYMCKMTGVTLTSVGGELWATFKLSKAYNALYPGTAEDAAASTNADGTDTSAYYLSDPLEGYVEREFSIVIPALNSPMTIATYSGGSKGIDGGMWYTRTVVFNSSSEVMAAIEEAKNPTPVDDEPDPSEEPEQPQNTSDEGETTDTEDESGNVSEVADQQGNDETQDDGETDDSGDDESSESSDSASSEQDSKSSASSGGSAATSNQEQEGNGAAAAPAAPAQQSEASSDASDSSSGSAASKSSEASKASSEAAAKTGPRGIGLTLVGDEVVLPDGSRPDVEMQAAEQDSAHNEGPVALAAVTFVNVALAAALALGIRRLYFQPSAEAGYGKDELDGEQVKE